MRKAPVQLCVAAAPARAQPTVESSPRGGQNSRGGSLAAKAEMQTRKYIPFHRSCCVTPGKIGLGVTSARKRGRPKTQLQIC